MTLKVNDTELFNLSMILIVHYDLEYIEIAVKLWNKSTRKTDTKFFKAGQFADALKHYDRLENFFF